MSDRTEYVNGLRAFADWLECNTNVAVPGEQRLLLPLSTNDAVAEFAAAHALEVSTDADGNTSCELAFGPLSYHAYGYRSFKEHCAAFEEKQARQWAEKNGIELPEQSDTDKQVAA